jgi:hypothetical protein
VARYSQMEDNHVSAELAAVITFEPGSEEMEVAVKLLSAACRSTFNIMVSAVDRCLGYTGRGLLGWWRLWGLAAVTCQAAGYHCAGSTSALHTGPGKPCPPPANSCTCLPPATTALHCASGNLQPCNVHPEPSLTSLTPPPPGGTELKMLLKVVDANLVAFVAMVQSAVTALLQRFQSTQAAPGAGEQRAGCTAAQVLGCLLHVGESMHRL